MIRILRIEQNVRGNIRDVLLLVRVVGDIEEHHKGRGVQKLLVRRRTQIPTLQYLASTVAWFNCRENLIQYFVRMASYHNQASSGSSAKVPATVEPYVDNALCDMKL